jgi:DNA-binding NarL/FixJ family response regulator
MKDKATLILVDDHAMFREGVRAILSELGSVSILGEATRGNEACSMALELHPELVIMDISLPDMSGIDATRRITQILPDARVIILSMHTRAAYIVEAFQAGAFGYVTKTSTGTHLKECIETVRGGTYYLDPHLSQDIVQKILFRGEPTSAFERSAYSALTSREQEVARLIVEGHPVKVIAERLFISRKTVENHRANIYAKLGIHGTMELVRHAARHGLIDIESWKA